LNDLGNRFASGAGVNKDEKNGARSFEGADYRGDSQGSSTLRLFPRSQMAAVWKRRGVGRDVV